ncbi:MAG: hypothetical protein J3Q66DRAFT_359841 [Benniella sp.]|nr:MAG: hypothetical protein J3Q66DRAFT_359841 [Benniella sp.]
MYRRRVVRPPAHTFPESLEELGFHIDENNQVIDSSGKPYEFDLKARDRDYQEAHSRALGDAIMRKMLKRMDDEFNLIKAKVPIGIDDNDTTSPQAHILLSPGVEKSERLLVLVPGTMETIGAWSRRLLTKHSTEIGSMYAVLKQALQEGYGVMMLNPNAHWWVDGRDTVMVPTRRQFELIPSLGSPEEHLDYVLRNFVQGYASKEIYFIAHKYGTHALAQALYNQFDTFKDRVAAIAVIDGTHAIDSFPEPVFQKWWSLNAAGYIQSEAEESGRVVYREHAGCNCVNAGAQEYDYTIVQEMPSIFRFFRSRKGRDNTFDNYKDVVQPLHPDDPTTAMITYHVPGGDEKEAESETTAAPESPKDASAAAGAATTADNQ